MDSDKIVEILLEKQSEIKELKVKNENLSKYNKSLENNLKELTEKSSDLDVSLHKCVM